MKLPPLPSGIAEVGISCFHRFARSQTGTAFRYQRSHENKQLMNPRLKCNTKLDLHHYTASLACAHMQLLHRVNQLFMRSSGVRFHEYALSGILEVPSHDVRFRMKHLKGPAPL